MPFNISTSVAWAGFLMLTAAATAHHAISVEFDPARRMTFEGVVTKIEWTNPHIYFYADIKDRAVRTRASRLLGDLRGPLRKSGYLGI